MFLLAPCKFHAATVEGGFGAEQYHCCFQDGDASIKRKGLAIFLFVHVDSEWEGGFHAGDQLGHVVVNIRLQNGLIGGLDVSDKIPLGDCVETFGGVIERGVEYIINGSQKLVAGDGCYDQVGIPGPLSSKAGGVGCFAGRSSSGGVDGILRGSGCGDDKRDPIALKVEDRVLEEAEMSFAVSPRARNGHEVGGHLLLEDLQLFVCRFSVDVGEGCMGHLRPDGLGEDSVQQRKHKGEACDKCQ
jgi:hypothetical protein